ncbi:MAG: glycosyl transferase family protein [Alteromonadaceae bacterium]|nr:glycosyl transferase family protein [Alteromonadaceae bacterium]
MNPFTQYIKIIGRGQRAGRYLTMQEAHDAYALLLSGQVTQAQAGAFLMLLRMREESETELAGFVSAARAMVSPHLNRLDVSLDLGGYAGKRRHLPWYLLAVWCLAQNGYRIFLHGHTEPASQRLYVESVFAQLGLPIANNALEAQRQLDFSGFCYMPLGAILPELCEVISMRDELGLRSSANTIARMLNPCQAPVSFHGVHHRHFDARHVATAQLLNDAHVACIRGEGGEPEVNPERVTELHQFCAGKITQTDVPETLSQWQIKPRHMEVENLLDVWQAEHSNVYAHAAVLATLTQYLMCLEQLNAEEARLRANAMWHARQRHLVGCHPTSTLRGDFFFPERSA